MRICNAAISISPPPTTSLANQAHDWKRCCNARVGCIKIAIAEAPARDKTRGRGWFSGRVRTTPQHRRERNEEMSAANGVPSVNKVTLYWDECCGGLEKRAVMAEGGEKEALAFYVHALASQHSVWQTKIGNPYFLPNRAPVRSCSFTTCHFVVPAFASSERNAFAESFLWSFMENK